MKTQPVLLLFAAVAIIITWLMPPPLFSGVGFREILTTDQVSVNASDDVDVTYVLPADLVRVSIKGMNGFAWRLGDDSDDITNDDYVPFSGAEAWNEDASLGGRTLYLRGNTTTPGEVAILMITRP